MLLLNLAPAIRSGLVQVHGVDLKGGMELGLGTGLFTRYANTAKEAVMLLEDAARRCPPGPPPWPGRQKPHPVSSCAAGRRLDRRLATLIAYLSNERDLTQRAEKALSVLLGQGRASGFVVWGFLQDPRKETVPLRHLFTQTLGLRLREREEVAMVLGDGAVAAGATCHKIPRTTAGVGVRPQGGRPTSPGCACGFVSDDMIRDFAAHFPAGEIPTRSLNPTHAVPGADPRRQHPHP